MQVAEPVDALEALGHDETVPRSQTEHGAPAKSPLKLRAGMVSSRGENVRAKIRGAEPGPPAEPGVYNGVTGYFFTAHIDSGDANTLFGAITHVLIDVVLGNLGFHHGC